jgi:hypothetical protein
MDSTLVYISLYTLSGIAEEIYVCAGGKLLKQKEEKAELRCVL